MDIHVLASGSSGNAILVSDGVTSLLLDAGLPAQKLTQSLWRAGTSLTNIHGVLLTHEHNDHSAAVKFCVKMGLNIYATEGTTKELGLVKGAPYINIVRPLSKLVIGTLTVLPFDVQHDAAEPVGFLLESSVTGERLLFATDTYFIKYKFKRIDYLLIECNYIERILAENIRSGSVAYGERVRSSHMELWTLLAMVETLKEHPIKEIFVLHMSNTNSDEAEVLEALQRASGSLVTIC